MLVGADDLAVRPFRLEVGVALGAVIHFDLLHRVGRQVLQGDLRIAREEILAVQQETLDKLSVDPYLPVLQLRARQLLHQGVEHRPLGQVEGRRVVDDGVAAHHHLDVGGPHGGLAQLDVAPLLQHEVTEAKGREASRDDEKILAPRFITLLFDAKRVLPLAIVEHQSMCTVSLRRINIGGLLQLVLGGNLNGVFVNKGEVRGLDFFTCNFFVHAELNPALLCRKGQR